MFPDLDPLSLLLGVPVLGPIVAYLLWDARSTREGHAAAMEHQQKAYQDLANKAMANMTTVVTENTGAVRGLEKAVDTLVRQGEQRRG